MNDPFSIRNGDKVTVSFDRAGTIFNAKVLSTPSNPGEGYYLEDEAGKVYLVQNFCYMKKL